MYPTHFQPCEWLGAKIQSSIYLSVYLTHFQPCEWLGAQIQSSVRLCIWLTFSHASGWVLKSNHFLCIWPTLSHASGWALNSNHSVCTWLTLSHASHPSFLDVPDAPVVKLCLLLGVELDVTDVAEEGVVAFNGHRGHPHVVAQHYGLIAQGLLGRRLLGLLRFGEGLVTFLVELLLVVVEGLRLLRLAMTVAKGGLWAAVVLRMRKRQAWPETDLSGRRQSGLQSRQQKVDDLFQHPVKIRKSNRQNKWKKERKVTKERNKHSCQLMSCCQRKRNMGIKWYITVNRTDSKMVWFEKIKNKREWKL